MSGSRRDFVATAAAACAAGVSLPGCATFATYRATASGGSVVVPRSEFATLAGEQKSMLVVADALAEPVILVEGDDGFHALSSTCTHQECQIRPGRLFLRCPCHGSTFDVRGAVVRGPAPRDLPAYPVAADAQDIRIGLQAAVPTAGEIE